MHAACPSRLDRTALPLSHDGDRPALAAFATDEPSHEDKTYRTADGEATGIDAEENSWDEEATKRARKEKKKKERKQKEREKKEKKARRQSTPVGAHSGRTVTLLCCPALMLGRPRSTRP